MNGPQKPTLSPSALAAPGGVVPAPAGPTLPLAELQRAVDLEFVDLEAHRAEFDLADRRFEAARAELVLAEAGREDARRAYFSSGDRLSAALTAMHAAAAEVKS